MKFKFMMAAVLIMAAACNQLQTVEEEKEITEGNDSVTVTVNVSGGASTRSTSITSADEKKVADLQLFAFNSDGNIDSYAKGTSTSLKINVTAGTKDFVALVNCPDLGNTARKADLMKTVSYLKNNKSGHFEMIGEVDGVKISANTNLDLKVKRIVSKVVIEKISADFTSPYLSSQIFKVTGIFLSNVVASNCYGLNASTFEDWVNKNEMSSTDPARDLTQDIFDVDVKSTTPYTTVHSFYCYPNPTATDSNSATWSERYTRLVVRTTLGGTVGYYNIKIPDIGSNKIYTIKELKITKRGSFYPYEDITTADAQFTITVSDWDTGKEFGTVTL